MNVYIFGNKDLEGDTVAIHTANKLKGKIKDIEFVEVKPNEDLPFVGEKEVVLMDSVEGINGVTIITEKDLDKLLPTKSVTTHDFDLGFQLRYLQKLGKLKKITIIGLPMSGKVDYQNLNELLLSFPRKRESTQTKPIVNIDSKSTSNVANASSE